MENHIEPLKANAIYFMSKKRWPKNPPERFYILQALLYSINQMQRLLVEAKGNINYHNALRSYCDNLELTISEEMEKYRYRKTNI